VVSTDGVAINDRYGRRVVVGVKRKKGNEEEEEEMI
jgi:hypothetical protein